MADTLPSETVTPEAPSNEPGTTTAPVTDNSSADVEAAKKQALQAELRARQLQNELDKIKADQDASRQKQLEEKEEFKTLYEQTQAKLREIEDSQSANERQAQLKTATDEVFKDYSADAVELATVAGLSLTDDSEEAVAALKAKLDIYQAKVGTSTPRPGASNPRETTPEVVDRATLVTRNAEGISPMAMASAKGDDSVTLKYINELPALKRMREMSQGA